MLNALREPQRIVLIGGTSDIGLAIVRQLLAPASHVCLLGRNLESLNFTRTELMNAGVSASAHTFAVTDTESHHRVVAEVFSSEVDIVIIAIGTLEGSADTAALGDAVHSLEVNGFGATALLLQCHARMQAQGHGVLVVLSSFAVSSPRPSNWVYGAGKAMLDFAARGLMSVKDNPVDVVLVRPGFVRTKMTAARAIAPFAVGPRAVAQAVATAVRAGGSHVVWVPKLLRHVARVFAMLPISVVRRLDR